MTFFSFLWEAATRSFHRAWELGHWFHALTVFLTGAFIVAGLKFGEHELIVVPFAVLFGAFLFGVLWFAYVIYRDEHAAAIGLQKALEELRSHPPAVSPANQRLTRLIEELGEISNWLGQSYSDEELFQDARNKLSKWIEQVKTFVQDEVPAAWPELQQELREYKPNTIVRAEYIGQTTVLIRGWENRLRKMLVVEKAK